jgi:prenyltransferase beta subunit
MKRAGLILAAVAVLSAVARGQSLEEKKQTIRAVLALQAPVPLLEVPNLAASDGAFFPGPTKDGKLQASLRATLAAVRVLKYFEGELPSREACQVFVAHCRNPYNGGFADHPGGKPDVATTAVGVMAVVDLKMRAQEYRYGVADYLKKHVKTFEDIRIAAAAYESLRDLSEMPEYAAQWLEQIGKLRNIDGTYGKGSGVARATGSAVAAVLRLGGKVEQRDHVVQALRQGQRLDGGFGTEGVATSDLETSYRVVRTFAMLKEKPDAEKMRSFIARCRNADGLYGVAPGQPSQIGATYYAAIILHWLAQEKP